MGTETVDLVSVWTPILNGLNNMVQPVVDARLSFSKGISVMSEFVNSLLTALESFIQKVIDLVIAFLDGIRNLASWVTATVGFVVNPWTSIKHLGSEIVERVRTRMQSILDKISDVWDSMTGIFGGSSSTSPVSGGVSVEMSPSVGDALASSSELANTGYTFVPGM
jgi:phage-related protein